MIIADHWNPESKEVILSMAFRNFKYKEATRESQQRSCLPSLIFEHAASRLVAM